MPSTGYRYYTVVLANALLAAGESIPDNAERRPDQMLRNLMSAYGYEGDHEASYATLVHDLERDGLDEFLKDLEAKGYWDEFIRRVALAEAAPYYTLGDPLQPLLDATAAFERAVEMLFDAGELVAGGELRDARYLLHGVTLDEVVSRVASRDPAVANGLLRATRRGGAAFDEHPLGAQFILARLFQLVEDLTGRSLYERVEGDVKSQGRPVKHVVREVAEQNGELAEQIERLRGRAPTYLGLAKDDACFRPQHVRPEATREGNPLKVLAQDLRKKADPALRAAVERVAELHRDPAVAFAIAFALPGAVPVLGMLEQALEQRRDGASDGSFPSGSTLLAWLYGPKTAVTPNGLPPELANFAGRDRLELACPSVLAEEALADLEWRLASLGLIPAEGAATDVITGFSNALMDVLRVVAPGVDRAVQHASTGAERSAAAVLWAKATYPHLLRAALSRAEFRERLKSLPALRGRPIPWTKVFGASRGDAADADGQPPAGLDFTEAWPSDEAPLAPSLHPFTRLFADPFDDEREAWAFDDKLKEWAERLAQRRGEVLPQTTSLLVRTLEAWAERLRLQAEPHVADARSRLFFVDGGKAAERAGFAPRSLRASDSDPEAWATDGPPPHAFYERFTLLDETSHADAEGVLDALQAFLEVVREVAEAVREEQWVVLREMTP